MKDIITAISELQNKPENFLTEDVTITVGPSVGSDYETLDEALAFVQTKQVSVSKGSISENGSLRAPLWTIKLESGDIDIHAVPSVTNDLGQIKIENQLNQVSIEGNADGTTRLVSPVGAADVTWFKFSNCTDIKFVDILEIECSYLEFSRTNAKINTKKSPLNDITVSKVYVWPNAFVDFQMGLITDSLSVISSSFCQIFGDLTLLNGFAYIKGDSQLSVNDIIVDGGQLAVLDASSIITGDITMNVTQDKPLIEKNFLQKNSSIVCTQIINNSTQLLGITLNEVTGDGSFVTDGNLVVGGGASELEKVTEVNTGWRLLGADPALYGDIGTGAVDLSKSTANSTTRGATGDYSFAVGKNTVASGESSFAAGEGSEATEAYAFAIGNYTHATGWDSFATGNQATAAGGASSALGNWCTANANNSLAQGSNTFAANENQAVFGNHNIGSVGTSVFEVGIGTSGANKKNAIEAHTDGMIVMPNLPTADPVVVGALWNDLGTLKISAG